MLEPFGEAGDDGRADRVGDRLDDRQQLADLHRREVGDVASVYPAAERRLAETCPLARRAGPLPQVGRDLLLRARRQRLEVAPDVGALNLFDDAHERDVHVAVAESHLDLPRLAVQQQVHLLLRELRQLLVLVEEARGRIGPALPRREERHLHGAFSERFGAVDEVVGDDAQLLAETIALSAHPLGIVERKGVRIADMRRADAREEQPQQRVDVRDRADGRVGAAAEPFLVHDHRHAQVLDGVGLRRRIPRQEAADEQAEVLVELPLCFRRDGIEHDGRFSGARDAGEDRDLPLGDAKGDVLEVVLARAADVDEFVHKVVCISHGICCPSGVLSR